MAASIAWRGHYVDATGYYYLGERYYAPDSGTFLSPDPLGHASSMDLYSAFDGDPINTFDPTGRCATDTSSSSGGFLSELAQVVVSLVAGALGIDEVPLSAAFGDVVSKAVVNVVLMVEMWQPTQTVSQRGK